MAAWSSRPDRQPPRAVVFGCAGPELLDRERRFVWVNRVAPGLTTADVIGTKMETFLAPESVQPTCETIDRGFATRTAGQCETEGYGNETSMRWVLNRVVPLAELMSEANAVAGKLAAGPTAAIGRVKKMLNATFSNDLTAQLKLEADCQVESGRSPDFKEGVSAFFEKRPPRFSGK